MLGSNLLSYKSVGATKVLQTPPYPSTHNLGTNRMSASAKDGYVIEMAKLGILKIYLSRMVANLLLGQLKTQH